MLLFLAFPGIFSLTHGGSQRPPLPSPAPSSSKHVRGFACEGSHWHKIKKRWLAEPPRRNNMVRERQKRSILGPSSVPPSLASACLAPKLCILYVFCFVSFFFWRGQTQPPNSFLVGGGEESYYPLPSFLPHTTTTTTYPPLPSSLLPPSPPSPPLLTPLPPSPPTLPTHTTTTTTTTQSFHSNRSVSGLNCGANTSG